MLIAEIDRDIPSPIDDCESMVEDENDPPSPIEVSILVDEYERRRQKPASVKRSIMSPCRTYGRSSKIKTFGGVQFEYIDAS